MNVALKTCCAWLFAAMVLSLSGCNVLTERAEIVEHTSRDFSGISEVRIETKNGSVDVGGEEARTEIDVHITKFARGRTQEEARRNAEAVEVEVSRESPGSHVLLVVVHVPPALRNKSAGANLDISLPSSVDLEIRTSNGRVGVRETEGWVDIGTSNGKVEISGVSGDVKAKTSNGAVVVEDVVGNAELRSTNGRITLERLDSERIVASTSNGKIEADDVSGNTSVETSNGAIELKIVSAPESPELRAKTSNGSIFMEVPSTVNARLSLQTSNGGIEKHLRDVTITDFDQTKHRLDATLGAGGGTIEARTSNGKITFRTKS